MKYIKSYKELYIFFTVYFSAHPGLCLTEPCVSVAAAVMGALDHSVDPCNDFYSYACGGWMKKNPLPEGKSRWDTFSNLWEHNMAVMKNLLGQSATNNCLFQLYEINTVVLNDIYLKNK